MLTVGTDQLDRMLAPHREGLARRITLLLRDAFPDEIAPLRYDDALALVDRRLGDGLAIGLCEQRHLFLHVALGPILGWGYAGEPDHGWVDAMLADCALGPAPDRLAIVLDLLHG